MKNYRWFLPVFVAVCCISCKESSADFTPYIQVSNFYVNPIYLGDTLVSAEDTISFAYVNGTYVLDSVDVDDNVAFAAGFGSYANELIAVRVHFDSTQLAMKTKLSDPIKNILLPSSDLDAIQLLLNPGYNYLAIPLTYTPKKSGAYTFSLVAESDSKFASSTVTFQQPVR